MDITTIVSTEFEEFTRESRVSRLVGTFEDPSVEGVVVRTDGDVEGVVTRRQLTTTHHSPDAKLGSIVRRVPAVDVDEDVREVARLMIDGGSRLLPVFDGEEMVGVVTADGLLGEVRPFLDVVTVGDAYSDDLVTVDPETTFGKALHLFREHRITHLPVVEEGSAVGILSLYDVTDVTVRATRQSQGGDAGGTDPFGGRISSSTARARRGGFGAREGELARILDLPVRDLMVSPVRSVRPDETLGAAVDAMFDAGVSSLVVSGPDADRPQGIVTKTDVLDALTWEAGGNRGVQIYGVDLLDDLGYEDIVAMVDRFDRMDRNTNVLDAKVHLHRHDERMRGTPLLLVRMRLYTDRGLFVASGEGYGASHATNEARDVLERQIREEKTYRRSKKPPDEAFWEKRFGWWLEA